MRGGTYIKNYLININDFKKFVAIINKKLSKELETILKDISEEILYNNLIELANKHNNTDFIRICYEYLPLTFSRRHGRPKQTME